MPAPAPFLVNSQSARLSNGQLGVVGGRLHRCLLTLISSAICLVLMVAIVGDKFGAAGLAAAAFFGAFFGSVIGFVLAQKFLPNLPSVDTMGTDQAREVVAVAGRSIAPEVAMDGAGALKAPLRDEDLESTFVGSEASTTASFSTTIER